MSFLRFVFACISNFFDGVVGSISPQTEEYRTISVISIIGGAVFVIAFLSSIYLILKYSAFHRIVEWIIITSVSVAVVFLYLGIVYLIVYH